MGNDDTRDKREPVAVTLAPLPWDKELWQMVKRQGITVVLLAVATWLLWGTWQADRVVWEQRMETTHKIHAEAVKELANQHTQQIKTLSDTFVTEQNRTERILGGRINVQAERVDRLRDKINDLPTN